MYIYLFWSHGEYGPENLKATTNRSRVLTTCKSCDTDGWFQRCNLDPSNALLPLLDKTDEDLSQGDGIHSLMGGWGGLHFQVVKEA